jgi:hypothetical protein
VKWLIGIALGILGGWALGRAAGLRGVRLDAAALGRIVGAVGGGEDGQAGRPAGGRRYDGLLEDDRLTRTARGRLIEQDVDLVRVDLTTVDSVMYLRGRPRTTQDAAAIVDIAETTPGVTRVVNELKPLDQEDAVAEPAKRS